MDPSGVAILLVAAAAAGWVDAVVGGGGLLLLPVLLVAAPGLPLATVLGTNKVAAIAGTGAAAVTYARRTVVDWAVVAPAAGVALVTAGVGAALAGWVPAGAFRPAVLAILLAVALMVMLRPAVGLHARPQRRTQGRMVLAVLVSGGLIGGYDGLVGPGTGTFLVLAFATLVGADFLHASVMAKVVNTATNLGALLVFAVTGHVHWWLGLAMAVCNVTGAAVGARMALRHGAGFVRWVLVAVVWALIAKLALDQWNA